MCDIWGICDNWETVRRRRLLDTSNCKSILRSEDWLLSTMVAGCHSSCAKPASPLVSAANNRYYHEEIKLFVPGSLCYLNIDNLQRLLVSHIGDMTGLSLNVQKYCNYQIRTEYSQQILTNFTNCLHSLCNYIGLSATKNRVCMRLDVVLLPRMNIALLHWRWIFISVLSDATLAWIDLSSLRITFPWMWIVYLLGIHLDKIQYMRWYSKICKTMSKKSINNPILTRRPTGVVFSLLRWRMKTSVVCEEQWKQSDDVWLVRKCQKPSLEPHALWMAGG